MPRFKSIDTEKFWRPVLVAALCCAAFWPTLKAGFMIDDPFLLRAVQIEPGLTLKGVVSDLTDNVHKERGTFYYRPLLGLLTRVEYAFWGGNAGGYHAVSLLFHAADSILVLYLLSLLGFGPLIALPAACLFAVNPVIIDDLFAATGGESMANFFLLAVLVLFAKNRWRAALLLSVPAVFAKESNVLLPALAALCFAFQGRPRREYAKLLWLLPVCGLFLAMRRLYVDAPPGVSAPQSLEFLFTAFPRLVLHYLRVLLVPLGLETWPVVFPLSPLWPVFLVLCAAAAGVLFLLPVPRRVTAFCLCWFFLMLAPRAPAVMATQVMMDKWVFMASPAVFVFLLFLLLKLRERPGPWARAVPHFLVAAVVLSWSVLAHAEARLRGSDEKNYRWTIRSGPRSFASYRLGIMLLRDGRAGEAVEVLRPLPELYPGKVDFQNAYNMALWHSGKRNEAWNLMKALARKYPGDAPVRENAARMRELMRPPGPGPAGQ